MKNSLNLLKVVALLLVGGTAFAGPNLAVSFVSDLKLDNSCNAIGSPASLAAANPPFRVVITNQSSGPVTVQSVTFNGNDSMKSVTGSNYIQPNSNDPLEQQYLLRSCDGKQIAPGQTCDIPMIVVVPGISSNSMQAMSAQDTFTVTATTDVSATDTATHSYTFSLAKTVTSSVPSLSLEAGSSDSNGVTPYLINNTSMEHKEVSIGCFFQDPGTQFRVASLMPSTAFDSLPSSSLAQQVCMRDPKEPAQNFAANLSTYYRGTGALLDLFDNSSEIPMPVYNTIVLMQSVNNHYSC